MLDEKTILTLLGESPGRPWTLDDLVARTGTSESALRTVRRLLKGLTKSGEVERLHGRRYRLTPAPAAFTSPQEPRLGVLRVVEKTAYIEPARNSDAHPILLERAPEGAADGLVVQYRITHPASRARAPIGEVIALLGRPGDRSVEITRLLIEHGLDRPFPAEAITEAEAYSETFEPEEIAGRRDLRDIPLVTIDGEDAKDFDDAVCVESRPDGHYTLYVAIADVSHYVRPNSALDAEALRRATSTYLTDRAIPMLPEQLSNHLCSLRPDRDRLCVVAEMVVDREGRTFDHLFYRAVMRSRARLTYTQVARALDGDPDETCSVLLPSLLRLYKVAGALLRRRIKRGSIDLDIAEPLIVFGENRIPRDVRRRERNDAHRLIEDLMLAANEAVASQMAERHQPTLYRVHDVPDQEKLARLGLLLEQLAIPYKMKKRVRPRDIAELVESIAQHEIGKELQSLVLRTMAQARYDVENIGHFGLAAEHYLHFTSPIRRYPDLMVHRLLMDAVHQHPAKYKKSELALIAEHSSQRERAAMEAERACLDLDRALVASAHIGEHFVGRISAVARFGLFVVIHEPFLEGLVPVATIGEDFFEVDEIGSTMRGRTTGRTYRIGQRVEVEIANVDLFRRKTELRLVNEPPLLAKERSHRHDRRPRRAARMDLRRGPRR